MLKWVCERRSRPCVERMIRANNLFFSSFTLPILFTSLDSPYCQNHLIFHSCSDHIFSSSPRSSQNTEYRQMSFRDWFSGRSDPVYLTACFLDRDERRRRCDGGCGCRMDGCRCDFDGGRDIRVRMGGKRAAGRRGGWRKNRCGVRF